MVEIYVLMGQDQTVRYVGQSRRAAIRFSWHVQAARRGERGYLYNWLRKALADGGVSYAVVERCLEEYADERECLWIRSYRALGINLVNRTDGGGGTRGWHHDWATRRRIGAASAGKIVTEETRRRISLAKRGVRLSSDHKQKIGAAMRGREVTDEARAAISNRMRGNKNCAGLKRSAEDIANKKLAAARGEKHPSAKLTNAQAQQVRTMFSAGVRQADIARHLGVDTVTVHRVVRGKTYNYSGVVQRLGQRPLEPRTQVRFLPPEPFLTEDT